MSLQLGLLLIGLIIVAVVVFTTLDRGRLRRSLPRRDAPGGEIARVPPTLASPDADAGPLDINPAPSRIGGSRQLRADAAVEPGRPSAEARLKSELEMIEEAAMMPLDLSPGLARRRKGPSRPAAPDEVIDFVITLPGEGPVRRDEALGIYKQNEYLLEKPRKLYGRNLDSGYWTELAEDPRESNYADLAITVQLVDAAGPIDESELNTFSQMGLKLADAFHRPTRFSLTFEAALERARQLHRFCEAFDVIAAMNVAARDKAGFRGRAVERAAQKLGMQFGARQIFHMKSVATPGCQHLFSLASMVKPGEFDPQRWDSMTTPGLTLFMSVPCAHHPAAVFDKLAETARILARNLGGQLLDQDHKPLDDRGIAVIRRQIEEIEEKMHAFGVVPGTETALRLFGGGVAQPEPGVPGSEVDTRA